MDDEVFTIVEVSDQDMNWEEFFKEKISEDEIKRGQEVLGIARGAFKELGDNDVPGAIEIAVNDLDAIIGKGWTDYLKSVLMTLIIDWQNSHADDMEDAKDIFYPEDLLKSVYILTRRVRDQQTTIDNLVYALEHLKKNDIKE